MRAERVTSAVETTGRAAEGVLLDHLDAVSLERAAVTAAAACARPTLRDSVDPARDDLCGNQNFTARSRHQRDACSMAWGCHFLAARPSQDGRVIAEK